MNHVVCLKHGTKYSADYVNVLYNMVRRNLTVPFEFTCFTENPQGLDSGIRVKELPNLPKTSGWWYKPMFFNPNLGLQGKLLFLDLDLIVFRNIDCLFEYDVNNFCIIRDFNRYMNRSWMKMNSSVFRLDIGTQSQVYTDYVKNPSLVVKRHHGDQDWIFNQVKTQWSFWPEDWIQSYKWEMRGKPSMVRDKSGRRNFKDIGEPKVLDTTKIAVFHGDPNPHDCLDPWVIDNWR